jgi:molybdate transport system ATP-binding protein
MLTLEFCQPLDHFELSITQQLPLQGIIGLFGASGCGKSTLLRVIAGLANIKQGHISLFERTLVCSERRQFVKPEQRQIGLVFQNSRLFPHLSVTENLLFAQKRCPQPRLNLADIMQLTHIEHLQHTDIKNLSGGEQQRVALARALLGEPKLLLLDEPLSALDQHNKVQLLTLLKTIQQRLQLPMFYVSHSLAELQFLADQLLVMANGKIIDFGDIHPVIHRLNHSDTEFQQTSLSLTVKAHLPQHGLTELTLNNRHSLYLPCLQANSQENGLGNIGEQLRCYILASDISVTLTEPHDSSIVNHLHGTIIQIEQPSLSQTQSVLLTIECVGQTFYVRISQYSRQHLSLTIGTMLYLQFKANALRTINHHH